MLYSKRERRTCQLLFARNSVHYVAVFFIVIRDTLASSTEKGVPYG